MNEEQKKLIESNPAHVDWLRGVRDRYEPEIARFGLERTLEDLRARSIISGHERDWIAEDTKEVPR